MVQLKYYYLLATIVVVYVDAQQRATTPGRPPATTPRRPPATTPRPQIHGQAFGANGGGGGGSSNGPCPPLLGPNFPNSQGARRQNAQGEQVLCQWVIISDRQNCPQFFQHCGPNPPMCNRQNEIWWQCVSSCEPSCGNPTPSCRRSCPRSGCQCFPSFLRNQNGLCVSRNQCAGGGGGDPNSCSRDSDCRGESNICVNRRCQPGCNSDNDCDELEQCQRGRCVERRQCRRDSQCRRDRVCVFGECRNIGSFVCRRDEDCPGSTTVCGRNGRCRFL